VEVLGADRGRTRHGKRGKKFELHLPDFTVKKERSEVRKLQSKSQTELLNDGTNRIWGEGRT